MKTRRRREMRLRDVVRIVSQFSRNDHEMSLVVADLINRGYVKARTSGRSQRIIVF
jgi:hypothetical protein